MKDKPMKDLKCEKCGRLESEIVDPTEPIDDNPAIALFYLAARSHGLVTKWICKACWNALPDNDPIKKDYINKH